ncbi:MAG: GGDEF domain-containing protein [Spirochaetes bacterium]|nr:GGDEF domain-containing protein [Spirochaetota bacterium]
MILILSIFLIAEQMVYGLFMSVPYSNLQKVYLLSALIMLIFAIVSIYFHRNVPVHLNIFHEIYELSFGAYGMAIALFRFLFIETDANAFRIPTVYIAVIYAVAVIYVFHYWQSFILYLVLSLGVIFLMPEIHPEIKSDRYAADICSNGIIAFMIAVIHYRNFLKEFLFKTQIESKNRDLIEKNHQIERINAGLEELSVRDDLTGLFNRRKLDDDLRFALNKSKRYNKDFSVIIMDVDHFKSINDTYGHVEGDIVLCEIANIILNNIRDVDTCGRWGGEEFLVICPEIDIVNAVHFAERLRQIIYLNTFHENLKVTSSFGVASYAECGNVDSLLRRADARLYEAKANGRNRVEPVLAAIDNGSDH